LYETVIVGNGFHLDCASHACAFLAYCAKAVAWLAQSKATSYSFLVPLTTEWLPFCGFLPLTHVMCLGHAMTPVMAGDERIIERERRGPSGGVTGGDIVVKISCFGDEIASDIDTQIEVMTAQRVRYLEMRSADGVPVLTLDDDHARTIKDKLDASGIRVSAIASPIGKVKVTDPFDPHLDAFGRAIDLAKFFETPNIRVFSYYAPEGSEPAAYRDEIMRRMRAKADVAEQSGVLMLHENEKEIYGDTAERCEDILRTVSSPNLRAIIDPANFVECGVRPFDDAYRRYGAEVDYFHIKDAVGSTGEIVPAGDGDGQIPDILAALRDRDFAGVLSLEPHLKVAGKSSGFSGPDLFRKAVRALRSVMYEAGLTEETG